jgi:hypothetical protein
MVKTGGPTLISTGIASKRNIRLRGCIGMTMRRLGVLLVSGLLLLAPTGAMAESESGAPDATGAVDCTVDASLPCAQQPDAAASDVPAETVPAADVETSPSVADAAPTPAPVTRTLAPPTVVQSPFAPAAAVQSAPAERVEPLAPRPAQHLPPGPPSRWP